MREEILEAWKFLRQNNNTISDETIDFMRDSAILILNNFHDPRKLVPAAVVPPLTDEEIQACKWALNQQFNSVAAKNARVLAIYIKKVKEIEK